MNRKQTHILIVCGVLALVVAILLAACDDNGTPTLPKAPLNTMLNQKAGVCHLSNTSGGSSAAPLLAAPVLVPDVAYLLFFPTGDAVLPPDPGEDFTFAVSPGGDVVMQARKGEIEAAPEGERSFTVPQGEQWTLIPGTSAAIVDRPEEFPLLDLDLFVPPEGIEAPSIISAVPPGPPVIIEEIPAVESDCMGGEGGTVSMIGVWSGDEEGTFKGILEPFLDECDITLEYEGTRDLAVYSTRIEGGNPPDIAGLPNPGLLAQFKDYMVPLGGVVDLGQYSPAWQSLGSVDGMVYGAFFKADTKSLVWYSPPLFEAMGYAVPTTWDEMMALMDHVVAVGGVPLSCGIESGGATGWVATDWIQDILLRTQGADFVEQWARHEVAWTDAAIKEAFEAYYDLCGSDEYALGGAQGTLNTTFQESLYPPFADPPGAYMVRQASFAGGLIAEQFPDLVAGEDFTFFMFPEVDSSIGAPMQGGADVMALFNADNAAAVALMKYMFGAEGGKELAASGWGLSPNNGVTASDYGSALQGQAATLMNEAPAFSFDADDRFPGGLNVDYWQAIVEYLNGGDLDAILERMEARASEVY